MDLVCKIKFIDLLTKNEIISIAEKQNSCQGRNYKRRQYINLIMDQFIKIKYIINRMGFNQDKRAMLISNILKTVAVGSFTALVGFLLYNVATAEKRGRERALAYQQQKGKRKPKQLLPDHLQPQYIQKQRRKYRALVQKQKQQI